MNTITHAHLCFNYSVNNRFQSLIRITFNDSFNKTLSPPNRLLHAHAQVIVRFLCGKILPNKIMPQTDHS